MRPTALFAPSYDVARQRFRDAAASAGARVECYPVETGTSDANLTIDVATLGHAAPSWSVVVTSGVHGVEGFFGSAIQTAWLSRPAPAALGAAGGAVVLVHAVNPYGFARLRRTNEDNIDLNRNFLDGESAYSGTPAGYGDLDPLLNPASPPARLEPFRLKAFWHIWRQGLPVLKEVVAGGQHGYPRGLFFGGHGPAASTRIVQRHLADWLGDADQSLFVDLHSGLGAHGRYRLLLVESAQSRALEWYRDTFGAGIVEPLTSTDSTAYEASGTLGGWALRHLGGPRHRYVGAEFGTYPILRVLGALRAENRAHHFCQPGTGAYDRAKAELLECFCPRSDRWRNLVVAQGLDIIDRAIVAQDAA